MGIEVLNLYYLYGDGLPIAKDLSEIPFEWTIYPRQVNKLASIILEH